MSENTHRENLVVNLLSQDHHLTDSQIDEYRMKLEQQMEKAERQARRMPFAICVAVVAYYLAALSQPLTGLMGPVWNITRLVIYTASPLCVVWFLVVYVVKYRSVVEQSRTQFQTTIILQLQRQVGELTERLNKEG